MSVPFSKRGLRWPFVLAFLLACCVLETCWSASNASTPLIPAIKDPAVQRDLQNLQNATIYPNISTGTAQNFTIVNASISVLTVTNLTASTGTVKSFMVVGASDGSDAPTGRIGEYAHVTVGSTNFPANGTWGDATSFTVSAGDWDFTAQYDVSTNPAATTDIEIGISQTSGNSATGLVQGDNREAASVTTSSPGVFPMYIVNYRISSASPITAYLKFMAAYPSGQPVISGGKLSARRIR